MNKELELWEIMVPTMRNDGRPIKTRFHRVWDQKVYKITNGLTILQPSRGKWVSPEGTMFEERMIPVRIACTRDQIEAIIAMSLFYYEQEAILAYRVSSDVIIWYKDNVKRGPRLSTKENPNSLE